MRLHGWNMVAEPIVAALFYARAKPFGGNQRLFLYV
jgi:hypothetical protein